MTAPLDATLRRQAEQVARMFHERYEELAPAHGWETQTASRKDWQDVPENNRALMIAVVERLFADGAFWRVLDDVRPVLEERVP